MWSSCLVTCLMLFARSVTSSLVQTTHGPIEGATLTTFDGKQVDAFLGVPYAAPPLGRNRFAPPQPVRPWKKTLQTKTLPKTCVQFVTEEMRKTMWYVSDQPESEDCLHLNVWRPRGVESKMPVMVWIHGGGFVSGSSNMPVHDGSILSTQKKVIVASINYRLGPFGFLYQNNSEVPGNAGLQDQIQAIRWIRDNAPAFGGDPDRITIFGHSAGSESVNSHLTNRKVFPLFRYAIMQSVTMNAPPTTASESEALQAFASLTRQVGCHDGDASVALSCLRNTSIEALVGTIRGLFSQTSISYCPVRNGVEVPRDVSDVASTVAASDRKNVMVGHVPFELSLSAAEFFPGQKLTEAFTVSPQDMSNALTHLLRLRDRRLQSVVLHEYKSYGDAHNASQMRIEAMAVLSESLIICPQIDFAERWTTPTNPVYYYEFDHRPRIPLKFPMPEWVGTIHGNEIPLVFGAALDPENGYSEEDRTLSQAMMDFWTNFAKNGDPNGGNLNGPSWPPLGGNGTCMEFRRGVRSKTLTILGRCDFWTSVYPNLLSLQGELDKGKAAAKTK